MAQFGGLLSELRKDKNMSQAELANVLFVSSGTISNYENGVHMPDVEKLVELADYFHVSTDYLLGRSSSRLPTDVFDDELLEGTSVGQVIQEIRGLSKERKRALLVLLEDMAFRTMVGKYQKETL